MQAGLGSFYSWSVFREPLSSLYGANITRVNVAFFLAIFLLQAAAFSLLPLLEPLSFAAFCALSFVALMICYGGGYGTMPALVSAYYGSGDVGTIYASIMSASGVAGFGAPLLLALTADATGSYGPALYRPQTTLVPRVIEEEAHHLRRGRGGQCTSRAGSRPASAAHWWRTCSPLRGWTVPSRSPWRMMGGTDLVRSTALDSPAARVFPRAGTVGVRGEVPEEVVAVGAGAH